MSFELLSIKILNELENSSSKFSNFQNKTIGACPPGCGQCCLSPEVTCSPYELLPLAMHLVKTGMAEESLKKASESRNGICTLLKINDLENERATCTYYKYRPLVCRAFGISGRRSKSSNIELSICKKLKESFLNELNFCEADVVFGSEERIRLEIIDASLLLPQMNINEALIMMLNKIMLWNSYLKESSSPV